jgi:type IV pilus assembly protein PilN
MRITLNLATRPYANIGPAIKRLRIAMVALGVLCIIFIVGLHLFDRQADAARELEHSLDGRLARVQGERAAASAMMRRPENARVLTQAEALNQLFDEKAFSWTLAMEAMETVLPAGVQVTSIEPIRAPDGHITVHVRVVGPRDHADDLVANLERSRRFLQPRIVGENAESSNNPQQRQEPISLSNRFDFDLLAEYNPPTLAEQRIASQRVETRNARHSSPPIPLGIENPEHRRPNPAIPQGEGRPPYTGPTQGGPR